MGARLVDHATQYAKRVASGRVLAGPHVRAACSRHLRDLECGAERGLVWDKRAAHRAIQFFPDVLRLAGGEWEGRPYQLLDWQAFIVGALFGWCDPHGHRRYRVAYVETGKGSGKSPLAAGIGLYGLVADGEPRAEIYAAATKRDQAMVLFRDAVAMVDQSPRLSARVRKSGVGENVWNLSYLSQGSFFRAISSDEGQSGPRPHIALLDEVHEHRDGRMVELMRAGTKGRRQALLFMITNSGVGRSSYCWERHDYATKVAAGALDDDSLFSYVCALDEGEEPFDDPACWPKANPSLGITIPSKYLEEQIREARGMPSKEALVRRLNFCQWVDASTPFLSLETWRRGAEAPSEEILRVGPVYAGLDLSSRQDLTALVLTARAPDGTEHVRPYFWAPAEGVRERSDRDRAPYDVWARQGLLELTPGVSIGYDWVAHRLAELSGRYPIRALRYDRWRIADLKRELDRIGCRLPLEEHGQGYRDMSPSVDNLEALVTAGRLRHGMHPILTWCVSNTVATQDAAGNRKPDKSKATGRIDGLVALAMALATKPEPPAFPYHARGIRSIDLRAGA